ncbi:MAG TPA: sulfatase [Candidatus Saccharimonadales bacterium]|nr:sulfatase [Candidatus Saccharimonadales bacterium]
MRNSASRAWLAAVLVAGATLFGYVDVEAADRPPNIILILSDTTRPDFIGAFGFDGDVSPNLDHLASDAAVFTHAVSTAPWTKPAVASVFTSLDPLTHRVVDHDGEFWTQVRGEFKSSALPKAAHTLAEVLNAHGYRTGAWVANSWITKNMQFDQGFERFVDTSENIQEGEKVWTPAWQWASNPGNDKRPFFLYIHLMDVHGPWAWSQEDFDAVRKSPSLTTGLSRKKADSEVEVPMARKVKFKVPDKRLATYRAVYASRIRAMDRHLGRFFAELEKSGVSDQTVIVFMADHGEEIMDHGKNGHGQGLTGDQTRVPLIIRPPGGRDEERTITDPVSNIDVMPTLLEAAGIQDGPPEMQGTSLWRAVVSDRPLKHSDLVFSDAVKQAPKMTSVQSSEYELIEFGSTTPPGVQLFDLTKDPAEQLDVAKSLPKVAQKLKEELDDHLEILSKTKTLLQTQGKMSKEQMEKLKSLGYVD